MIVGVRFYGGGLVRAAPTSPRSIGFCAIWESISSSSSSARFNTAWPSSTDKTVGTVADLARRVKQMLADEKAEKLRPPSEPPVLDAATKRLETLGTLTIQASSLLAKRQASAEVMREVAAQLQADKAAAAETTEVPGTTPAPCASRMSPRRWKWAATSRCWS